MRDAAITGWAWRTPLGDRIDGVLGRLWAGERATAIITRFDSDTFECRQAASIDLDPAPSRQQRFLPRMGRFALEAAREALADSCPDVPGDRLGLFFGYGGLRAHWNEMMPALARQQTDGTRAWERGLKLLHPFWMLQHLSNNAHALAAEEFGARGDGLTVAGANAGAQALESAARALAVGAVDAAVVVGYDSLVEPETLVELAMRGGFVGAGPPVAPYDRAAMGFIPGEAASAVVLERRTRAGGRARALLDAWTAACGTSAEPSRDAWVNLLRALPSTGAPVGVVDGAARASATHDLAERAALASRPDLIRTDTPICATLGAMGQLGAAASVTQAIVLSASLTAGRLPPVAALASPAPGPLRPLTTVESTTDSVGLGLATGAPGLLGMVRVELP